MPEYHRGQQQSPSPSSRTGPMLPPLSKYYYGPAQGWNSTESSPSHDGSSWSLNHHDTPPTLPPRLSPGPPAYTSPQWVNHSPYSAGSSQGWHSPGPPPSAPPASQLAKVSHTSHGNLSTSITNHSHVNPTWDSGPPDTSTWGVKYNQKGAQGSEPASKPPLPPRSHHQTPDQPITPQSKTPSSRLSATTIEVPVFLQPVAYDPASAPPLPEPRQPPLKGVQSSILAPPEPERLPPPPPQKIPLVHEDMAQAPRPMPQRPWYDPQYTYDDGQQKDSLMSQRPRFDPQNSHDARNRSYQWHSQEQRPTIPVPPFTSFDVESALPPPEMQSKLSLPSQQILAQSTTVTQSNDLNRYEAGEYFHKSSTSPVGLSDADRRAPMSKPWEPQAAYAPSPEQQDAVLSPPDGQSISTADLSVETAGVSTPGSHQTSNTSYRENEIQGDLDRPEHQGGDSFYWHSGRSSSYGEEGQDQSGSPTATPGGDSVGQRSSTMTSMKLQREHHGLPMRSTSLSPTASATYGASALGFGGPSDWEYFGDYEAEEIDDEELYSRPRPRDSKSVVAGSTELPVDSPLDSIQPHNESDLPGPDSTKLRNRSLHEIIPARSLIERSSQENVVQELRVSGEGEYETDARPPSAAASGQVASSSDTHGQQRPDLDDVIRAWSEAPYVGKVPEVAPTTEVLPDNDEEPANVAEASLASTPRERMLGVDLILKGAPSLPKLPDSMNFQNSDDRELQRNANVSAASSNHILTTTNHGPQTRPLSDQQEPATNHMSAKEKAKPKTDEGHLPESKNIMQNVLPAVDVALSSGLPWSIPVELSVNKTETTQTDLDEKPHSLSQRSDVELDQQGPQNMIREKLESDNREESKRVWQEVKSELSQLPGGSSSHESITKVSAETIESLSRGHSPSKQSMTSPVTTQGNPYSFEPRNASLDKFDTGANTKPMQHHSQEYIKTPDTHANDDSSPPSGNVNAASPQATHPPLTSDTSLPHQTTLSELDIVRDPYSDLDPWGKASLNRFAAMLREESRAETNQDKLNIFNVFTSRESRLRVVLYGTDDELIIPRKPAQQKLETREKPEKRGFVKQAVERANSLGLERSLKALPALPKNRESVIGLPGNALAPLVIEQSSTRKGRVVNSKVGSSEDGSESKEEKEMSNGDDSYVMVNSPSDEAEYSPGGRPVVAHLVKTGLETDVDSSRDARPASEKNNTVPSKTSESAGRADFPGSGGPTAVGPGSFGIPKMPGQKPLSGRSEVKSYLANRKSVCRPYATLTQGSLEGASTFGREENINLAGAPGTIMAPTSQYNPSSQVKVEDVTEAAATAKQKPVGGKGPSDLRRFVKADFDPLLLVLPKSDAVIHESARILDLRNVMEAVPDDFSFIHERVVAWDAKAKKQREENDRQRHARQVESEQKIDSLFDDHEIGYGDIAELEIEFKRSEAAKRVEEDRSEYRTFVSDVFSLVWTRLHYELDQLIPHYKQYSKLMDHTLAGKDMFEGSDEGLALGSTMSSFLALHQKLEIRHQKAFEAVLERDRRLKKTEISPWYTLSNIAKVKQLEKQFENAEKKAIIEYCQQRDARANQLMDVLDQNTLRGVGANQDYMEAIMKAVRRIASGRAFASVPASNEPTAGLEEVQKAKAVTALLALSSEQVVQTFHVADMLLNSADYEVSVAKAKIAKADMATLAKLKEERTKEDQKLMRDLEHRLALIREDSRRTNDEIVKLLLFLGVQNGRADSAPGQAETADPKHEARIQKALEEAKKRNAAEFRG